MREYHILSFIEKLKTTFRSQLTFDADHVPLLFQEPGVLTGYRIPNMPWTYYIRSVFQIHNETINIWTHLIAFLLILYKTWNSVQEYEADDPYFSVYVGFGICCLLYTFFSALAHTVHSKSPCIHYTCYQADYAGIGFYMLGSSFMLYYASCHIPFYDVLELYYIPFNVLMSWFGFVCCCVAKLKYRRPYPFKRKLWQLCSFGSQVLCVSVIIVFRYIDCWNDVTCSSSSLNHHTTVYLFMTSSVFFFSSHIPEKIWPGKFDIVGQGHQIFHVLVTIATLEQFKAAKIDFGSHSKMLNTHQPSLLKIVTSIVIYAIMAAVTIKCLQSFTKKRVRSDMEYETKLRNKRK